MTIRTSSLLSAAQALRAARIDEACENQEASLMGALEQMADALIVVAAIRRRFGAADLADRQKADRVVADALAIHLAVERVRDGWDLFCQRTRKQVRRLLRTA